VTGRVFISYRRQQSSGAAGRLYDFLSRRLSADAVFMDVDKLPPGRDFQVELDRTLANCDVLLAIVGPGWAAVTDEDGRRRLEDPDDFVRKEIRTALQRNIAVMPVLLDGAVMPSVDELPEDLHAFARRHAIELRHSRYGDDAEALAREVDEIAMPGISRRQPASQPACSAWRSCISQ
jgi:hypothetical protein